MSALKLGAVFNRDKPHVCLIAALQNPHSPTSTVLYHRLGRNSHITHIPRRGIRWVRRLPSQPDTVAHLGNTSIPELATSITLQSTGYAPLSPMCHTADRSDDSPSEASRAIRKKIKHGDNHQKYRALVVRPIVHHLPSPV